VKRLVVASIVAGLLLPVAAWAAIVVNQSIGGVALGMTQAQVRAKLGAPKKVTHTPPLGEQPAWTYFEYKSYFVSFACDPAHCTNQKLAPFVRSISTTAKSERTTHGIGVGSTLAQLKANEPRFKCQQAYDPVRIECNAPKPEGPITYFEVKKSLVTEIILSYAGEPR